MKFHRQQVLPHSECIQQSTINMEQEEALINLDILYTHTNRCLPPPVKLLITDYLVKSLNAHPWVKFDRGISNAEAVELYLHWLCLYETDSYYGL